MTIASYRFSAPGAFDFRVGNGHQLVIDNRRYDRSGPGKPWETGPWPGVPFRWARGYYQTVWDDRAAVRLLGTENVGGMRATVIGFVRPELPAWFRHVGRRRRARPQGRDASRGPSHVPYLQRVQ